MATKAVKAVKSVEAYKFPLRDYVYDAKMVSVTDGDTVKIDLDVGFDLTLRMDCRMKGMNAEGKKTVNGKKAMAFLQDLYPAGAAMRVQTFKDKAEKYGRYLIVVHNEKLTDTVNNTMLAQGLTKPYNGVGKAVDYPADAA